jgi:ABC-type multidrug transport system permease subunit
MVDARAPHRGAALQTWLSHALWDRVGQPFPSTITVETLRPATQQALDQRQEQMALWLVMSLVTIGVFVVPALLIEEKEARTLEMILATPATYGAVVLAKVATGLVYGLLAGGLILGLNGGFGSDAEWVVLFLFLGAAVLGEIGLLLGGLFDDMTDLNTWGTLVALVLMLPGMLYGLVTSGLFGVEGLQRLVQLLPTHYLLEGIYAALSGRASLERVSLALSVLCGAAVVLFVLNVAVVRRREA